MNGLSAVLSVVGSEAVDAVQLVFLVWEPHKANRRLVWTAASPGSGDRVADTAVSQPASVTAVVSH